MENIKNIIIESGVTDIGDAVFFNCKIQSITIPDTVTRIGNYAFIGFKKSKIILPNSVISLPIQHLIYLLKVIFLFKKNQL